jgi:ribosomal 50S subunit-associated protein YjgA (DUF615 family)
MAKRKTRKRKVNLGSSRKDHLQQVQRAYAYAKDVQARAYAASKCPSALFGLTQAMMATARAETHLHSAVDGGQKLGRQTTKLTDAIGALRKKLAKDYDGALKHCARPYPDQD